MKLVILVKAYQNKSFLKNREKVAGLLYKADKMVKLP